MMDSNPEGINQYSGSGGVKTPRMAERERLGKLAQRLSERTDKTGKKSDHEAAARVHEKHAKLLTGGARQLASFKASYHTKEAAGK
jgi:hypothetical protein